MTHEIVAERTEDMTTEHRCPECGLLLAVEKNGKLFIRFKTLQFVVTGGSVLTTCRRCQAMQEIDLSGRVDDPRATEASITTA